MKKITKHTVYGYFLTGLFILMTGSTLFSQTLDKGIRLIDVEKYKEANSFFENAITQNPKDADAFYQYGKLNIMEGKTDQAQANFQKGIAANKENALNVVGLGMVQLVKGDSTGAVKNFEEALDMVDNKDVKIVLAIADAYLLSDNKNISRPVDLLEKAKRYSKKNPAIFAKLGDIYLKNYNGSLAIQNYQTAIDYDKNLVKAYIGISQIYIKIKNYTEAEANLSTAIQLDSTYAPAYKELGEYYYSRKRYDMAAANYKKYIDFSEPTVTKQVRYATFLYLAKNYNEAIAVINSVTGKEKEDPQVTHIMAFSYYSMDDFKNGLPAFDKYFSSIDKKEISATDYEYYGKLQEKAGNDSLAIQSYKNALALDSSKVELYGEMGAIDMKNKKYAAVAEDYKLKEAKTGKALTPKEYIDFGRSYLFLKQYGKADSVFAKLTQIKPDLPLGYLMRARSTASIDSTSEAGLAKPHYDKFLELVEKSPDAPKYKREMIEAYSYLGYYYYLKQDNPTSKQYWQKVSALDPENKQASEALKALK